MSNHAGMSKVKAILALRQRGWSFKQIATELGLHRQTVSRYVRLHESSDAGFEESKPTRTPSGDDDSKSTQAPPGTRSSCERFRETILTMMQTGLSAKRIHQDLKSDHLFEGSYYSVRRFVQQLEGSHELPFRRMECAAGEEAQVDFGTGARVIVDGRRRKTHMFRIVLSYSRKAYSEVVYRQTTDNFIRCLENAFWHFGGVPKTLVIDNLRAAVKKADWYEPELTPKIEAFCEFYGTVILPTKPRMPRHKGKVESSVKYAKNNALKARTFANLDEQNAFLLDWEKSVADNRIHGTTKRHVGQVFENEEQQKLQSLRTDRFPCYQEGRRKVHRDGHVEVDKAYYSVPPEYYRRRVWVRWDTRLVRIFNDQFEELAVHVKQVAGKFSTNQDHLAAEKISGLERGTEWLLGKARYIGDHADQWAQEVIKVRGVQGVRVVQGLIHLSEKHHLKDINKACEIAISYGAYTLKCVRQLIKKQAPQQETLEFMDEHPIIRNIDTYGELVRQAFRPPSADGDQISEM